ncbi:MAG: hypothetical protein ACOYB0_09700 [Polynucleobacter sp.]
MKRKCLGCGNEFDGKEGDLCPRVVGKDKSCGCLSESIGPDKKIVEKTKEKANGGN